MYSISDPSTQVPASSFLSLLQQGSTESNSADVGHSFLNLNEIPGFSSTESSLMETPFLPKFGVPDENGNFAENSSLVHNLLMNNSFRNAGLMGPDFPDTPGADLPDHLPGDALNYHDLTNDLISQLSRDRDDQSVFTFPDLANTPSSHFEMDTDMTNMPICSTAFLNSAPAMFSSMTGSVEDQTSFMETPPTTPNQDFAPTTELSAEQRPLAYKPRSRLGGVSTLMETINEEDLEGLDIDFDEIIPRPGAILELSEGRMTSEDNNLNVFCENDLAEAKATSTLKTPDGEALDDDEDVFFEDGLLNNEAQLILKTPGIRAQNDGLKVFYEAASTVKPEPDTTPENVYPRLREAWLRCQGSRSLEPLLKEEIRLKIMKRRLDNGEEELSVDPPQTPEYQMTEVDQTRRDVRRAQNRGAARRFREKKKKKETDVKQQMNESQEKNRQLMAEKEALIRELSRLGQELLRHRHCGDCRLLQGAERLMHVLPDVTPHCQHIGDLDNIDARPR